MPFGILEKGFVVSALLILTGVEFPFLGSSGSSGNSLEADPVTQAILYVVYLLTFALMFVRWKHAVHVATKDKFLLMLVGLALASALWSDVPLLTLRRGIALVLTTLFGVYLTMRYSIREQLRLLAWMLGIAALLSILFVLVLPAYGTASGKFLGAWQGIYDQKNVLGRYMVLSAVIFLINARSSYKYRWVFWTGFGLSVGLVLMSTSATALVSLLILLALWPLYGGLRLPYTWAVPFLITVVIVGGGVVMLLLENLEVVTGALGKNTTLSGRTDLWPPLLEKIWQRPWLGYGYTGFWLGSEGESVDVWRVLSWQPSHAHNGWLQLLLDLGFLGTSLFAIGLLICFSQALIWLRSTKTAEGLWPLLFLTVLMFFNLTQSTTLERNNIFWVLYVVTSLSLLSQRNQVSKAGNITATSRKGKQVKDA